MKLPLVTLQTRRATTHLSSSYNLFPIDRQAHSGKRAAQVGLCEHKPSAIAVHQDQDLFWSSFTDHCFCRVWAWQETGGHWGKPGVIHSITTVMCQSVPLWPRTSCVPGLQSRVGPRKRVLWVCGGSIVRRGERQLAQTGFHWISRSPPVTGLGDAVFLSWLLFSSTGDGVINTTDD